MCKFFSMVLTKDSCFWLEKSDKHEDIIKHFELHPDGVRGANIVRVELTPPADCDWENLSKWNYHVDQDTLPDWYEPTAHEALARKHLAKRAETMPWLAVVKSEFDAAIKWATCTDPADRLKAEAAALVLVPGAKIHWVNTPQEGASLWASLWDSLRASLWYSIRDSLRASLWDSLWDSLRASLWASLRDSLRASLRVSLWYSIRASIRDSHHTPLARIARSIDPAAGTIDPAAGNFAWDAIEALRESCFAIWMLPGHVTLCERPSSVKMRDGRVVDIKWERHLEGKVD